MLDDLDRASIRLVPTFVWNSTQFPVLGGDTIATFIRDSQSRSRHLLARFIADFITRYKDRKTILFYELTNELNLLADLDLRRRECKVGTNPCVLDNFTTADMVAFSWDVVRLIKSLNPSRQMSSGYSIPRPAAWHLMRQPEFSSRGADWTPDTPEEFSSNLRAVHEPFDIISVHVYPVAENTRFRRPPGEEYKLVADAAAAAKIAYKPLFVGEFGDDFRVTPFLPQVLAEIVRNQVAFSAIWSWEFYQTSTYQTHNTDATRSSVEPGYSDDVIAMLMDTQRALGHVPLRMRERASPRVIVTWPLPCSAVDRPVEIAAVASDGAKGVTSVDFFVDGMYVARASSPLYFMHFDPAGRGQRIVHIDARAFSVSGAEATAHSRIRLNDADASCEVRSDGIFDSRQRFER
jgi:hypothetical protein